MDQCLCQRARESWTNPWFCQQFAKAFVLHSGAEGKRTRNLSSFSSTSEFLFGIQTQLCVLPNGLDISVWLAQYQPFSLRRTSHSREEKRDFKEFTIWLNLKGISGGKKKKALYNQGALSLPVWEALQTQGRIIRGTPKKRSPLFFLVQNIWQPN